MTEMSQDRSEPQVAERDEVAGVGPETADSQAAAPSPGKTELAEHAAVVERVSAILQSAEAAAEAIRAEAVAKAEEVGRAHLSQMKEEAARIRNDAESAAKEAQSAAESYGATQRREAEKRVQEMLAQAETQARATRQAAEEMAQQIEKAARDREEKLKAQMRPLETSLRRALEAFRGITGQLEELLAEEPARQGETLVEALSSPVQRSGEWQEGQPQQERTNG